MKFDFSPSGIKQYIKKLEEDAAKVNRENAISAFQIVSIKTPVYTGNARWNWWCSVGSPSGKYEEHKGLSIDTSRALTFEGVTINDVLYVSNSTPYIKRLNEGWSRQAPARFVEMAVEEIKNRRRRI